MRAIIHIMHFLRSNCLIQNAIVNVMVSGFRDQMVGLSLTIDYDFFGSLLSAIGKIYIRGVLKPEKHKIDQDLRLHLSY